MLLVLFLLSAVLWIAVMVFERRTIQSGFLLLLTAALLGAYLISLAQSAPEWFSAHILMHLLLDAELIFLGILLIAYPVAMIPLFFIGGVILLKQEGIKFRNTLAVGLASAFIAFDIIYPFFFEVTAGGPAAYIYWYMTLISMYFVIELASFVLSGLLNMLHFKKDQGLSYVVVLGAGLSGDKPTPLLRSRIDKGIEVYRNNPGARLIFSGGQGGDEPVPESRAMANYAMEAGVAAEDIIEENRSRNTEENLRFSSALMDDGVKGRFAVVTSSYHLMRALLITRRLKLRCIGYGAVTKLYFSVNAILREYAGYIRDTRRKWIFKLVLLSVIYLIFVYNH